jgi:tetratricopeptide (TPR) repeat protein
LISAINVFNAKWHTNFIKIFELPKILAFLFSKLITMKKIYFIALCALFVVACNDNNKEAKLFFEKGASEMVVTIDSVKRLESYKIAIKDFDKAIALDPNYKEAYARRAIIRNEFGDYPGCLQDFKKIIEIDPTEKFVYISLAGVKLSRKDYQGALQATDKFLTMDTKTASCYDLRAQIKLELKDNAGALKEYDQAISVASSNDESLKYYYFNRGVAKEQLGDKRSACPDYQKALELGYSYAQKNVDDCK